tara:strand:- start:371 stop:643 length:273 start_codon:yes stop_codon:yes gene_type:complete
VATEEPQLNQSLQEGSVEHSGLNEPEGKALVEVGQRAIQAAEARDEMGDFALGALTGIGVGFAVILLAWTIMRTISEGFGWPYYGWPYSG